MSKSIVKYKLTLAYDGTAYSGRQVQPNGLSIQEVVQDKLEVYFKHRPHLTGSGRTDSGVHARGQTAHIEVEGPLDLFRFRHAVNSLLPPDIRLVQVEEVPMDFHARFSATGKIYTYHLTLAPFQDPFRRNFSWHVPYRDFSLAEMQKAAQKFLGKHDFKGFASQSHKGVAARDSIREVRRFEFHLPKDPLQGELVLEIEADGFLYKMVRNLVGTLVDISCGRLSPSAIDRVFEERCRAHAGQTAPAHALFLDTVLYS